MRKTKKEQIWPEEVNVKFLTSFNNMVDNINYKKHFIWLLGMFLFSLLLWGIIILGLINET
ncbi:MAG: hypothetical protein SO314_04870 [Alphaproteobacteria bacterium]|nr:hypothetical protein [Alphaproteobacteria bacterium]